MSSLVFLIAVLALCAGYFFYGKFIRNILGVDPKIATPAHTRYDGVDYVPAKNWLILFGHHFASIAGAGPIVGPIIAYLYWGWGGVIFWIIFGSIFMGAVHDFSSLFLSLREEGRSIGQIAQKYISKKASIIFLIFLWCALTIVIAVFASLCAKSFIDEPRIVIPSLGLIPVALVVGLFIYRLKVNTLFSTILGIALLVILIFVGAKFPIRLESAYAGQIWLGVLFIYAFFASVIPVNILLQPRDYISSFLLFFGIIVAFIGIIIKPLPIGSAIFFRFNSALGPFFPIMFITVACGAISGFHSLVSSGTTSKQIAREEDAQKVGYGAMILEAVLAAIAVVIVAFGIKNIPQASTPIDIFALGFGRIVFFLGDYANSIALLILNAFILTTLDTATRINRLLTQEILGMKNKYFATLIVVVFTIYLCLSGSWQALWPMFGASNQLVAALALLIISAYLIEKKRNYKVTLIPAIIMFLITLSALFIETYGFFKKKDYLLSFIGCILIVLGIFIIGEFTGKKKSYA